MFLTEAHKAAIGVINAGGSIYKAIDAALEIERQACAKIAHDSADDLQGRLNELGGVLDITPDEVVNGQLVIGNLIRCRALMEERKELAKLAGSMEVDHEA